MLTEYPLLKVLNSNNKTVLADISTVDGSNFYISLYYQGIVPISVTPNGNGIYIISESVFVVQTKTTVHSGYPISSYLALVASDDTLYIVDS